MKKLFLLVLGLFFTFNGFAQITSTSIVNDTPTTYQLLFYMTDSSCNIVSTGQTSVGPNQVIQYNATPGTSLRMVRFWEGPSCANNNANNLGRVPTSCDPCPQLAPNVVFYSTAACGPYGGVARFSWDTFGCNAAMRIIPN